MSRAYRGWVLLLFPLIATFGFVDRIVVQILVQPIKAELHATDAQMGLLGGLTFAVLYVLLSIPIARLAERKNRVAITSIGAALWSIATAACGFASSFGNLLVARIGVGIGEAAGQPATYSMIADYFSRARRGAAMAIYGLSVPLGAFLGGTGGGYVAQHWGWRAAFLWAGLPCLVLALLQWLTVREPVRGFHDKEDSARTAAPPFSAVLRRFAQRPAFLKFLVGALFSTIGGYGVNYFVAAYLVRRYGLDYAQAGLITGLVSSVPAALSIMAGGFLTDWAGRRDARWYAFIPALGAVLTTPLYIASFTAGTWILCTVLLGATAVCQYAYIPAAAAVTQNMMEPRMRASATAVTYLVYTLVGQGGGPLIVGAMSDHFSRGTTLAAQTAGGGSGAQGLERALIVMALVYWVSAAFMVWSARRLARELRGEV
jgi:MFS family permease